MFHHFTFRDPNEVLAGLGLRTSSLSVIGNSLLLKRAKLTVDRR